LRWIEDGYRRALRVCLGRPTIVYVLSAAAAAGVVVLGATVWREFLPELDEG
jgi:cobalt-zinc-cadmium resistance protein CzcA